MLLEKKVVKRLRKDKMHEQDIQTTSKLYSYIIAFDKLVFGDKPMSIVILNSTSPYIACYIPKQGNDEDCYGIFSQDIRSHALRLPKKYLVRDTDGEILLLSEQGAEASDEQTYLMSIAARLVRHRMQTIIPRYFAAFTPECETGDAFQNAIVDLVTYRFNEKSMDAAKAGTKKEDILERMSPSNFDATVMEEIVRHTICECRDENDIKNLLWSRAK